MKSISPALARFALKTFLNLGFLALCMVGGRPATAQIANISTRALSGKRDAVVVTEFAAQGTGTKDVLLRGLGPSLRQFGVPDPLRNPNLSLLDDQGTILDYNDDWVDSPDKDAIIATGIPPTNKRESAILYTLSPGIIYTSVERGARNTTGIAISDVYDLGTSGESILISAIGTRGQVETGDDVLISGEILQGSSPIGILIRALGPSLAAAGVSHALPDPFLELHNANGQLIASNDNWKDTQEFEIEETGLAPTSDLESAIVATLTPGAYTAIVSGVGGGVGIGFVQFYSLAVPVPGPELNPAPIIPR